MRKYHKVTIDELLDAAGGKSYVGELHRNTAYELLNEVQDKYMDGIKAEIVGWLGEDEIFEWCDVNCNRSNY
jgi:hypothetical protein